MSELKFVGFPHRGQFVQLVPADKPDLVAAKRHFSNLMIGKDRAFLRTLCEAETKAEKEGLHDAQSIHCGISARHGGKFEINYRFAVKDEKGEVIPAALLWNVYATLNKNIVSEVEVGVEMVTP